MNLTNENLDLFSITFYKVLFPSCYDIQAFSSSFSSWIRYHKLDNHLVESCRGLKRSLVDDAVGILIDFDEHLEGMVANDVHCDDEGMESGEEGDESNSDGEEIRFDDEIVEEDGSGGVGVMI